MIIEMPLLKYCTLLSKESLFQKSDEKDNYIIQKVVIKKVKNQHDLQGRKDFLVTIIE